ncbi:hypothetical protein M3194_12740 [Paenibacillus glycanilyticus]|uniref:hypothetical protein n=1 Tax=Paenibacillus glycanilyticus TaxID=126569 RepID=UPI00203CD332|nr:hypothetical protein [Paenibacillus glycanilyticus]MCM3628232.1 hypothetical protein [Paenibacillus glycanilyticus]
MENQSKHSFVVIDIDLFQPSWYNWAYDFTLSLYQQLTSMAMAWSIGRIKAGHFGTGVNAILHAEIAGRLHLIAATNRAILEASASWIALF